MAGPYAGVLETDGMRSALIVKQSLESTRIQLGCMPDRRKMTSCHPAT